MSEQGARPLESPRRADVLAEGRHREPRNEPHENRNGNDEHDKENVFEIGKGPCHPAFSDFPGRKLVQKLLDEPERADPAADRPPQDEAKQHQRADNIEKRPPRHGRERILKGSERAGADRARAGIAVKPRHADLLAAPGVDIPSDEAFHVRIVENCAVKLHEASSGGPYSLPFIF